ncbi:MAG: hypothetical protein KAS04_02630 [Candidatus Aenigmarchaeota archaeon]|nr:hypothetical protein [Candidatus Aenigmarchaeota archaeon]
MSWIQVSGTVFVALAIVAGVFYFGGGLLAQFGTSTGMATLKDVGSGGIGIGISLIVVLVVFAAIVLYLMYSKR